MVPAVNQNRIFCGLFAQKISNFWQIISTLLRLLQIVCGLFEIICWNICGLFVGLFEIICWIFADCNIIVWNYLSVYCRVLFWAKTAAGLLGGRPAVRSPAQTHFNVAVSFCQSRFCWSELRAREVVHKHTNNLIDASILLISIFHQCSFGIWDYIQTIFRLLEIICQVIWLEDYLQVTWDYLLDYLKIIWRLFAGYLD